MGNNNFFDETTIKEWKESWEEKHGEEWKGKYGENWEEKCQKKCSQECTIIYSLDHLITYEYALSKEKKSYLFRGQFNSNWKLESSYKREWKKEYKEAKTKALINRFTKQIEEINDKSAIEKNDLEIVSKLQHYGLPTLLLDFTSSFWIALWFAISEYKLILNPSKECCFKLYYFEQENILYEEYKNLKWDEKMVYHCPSEIKYGLSQKSYFILDNFDDLEKQWNIKSIIVPFALINEISLFLQKKRISASTIFPGSKGLYLEYKNNSRKNNFSLIEDMYEIKNFTQNEDVFFKWNSKYRNGFTKESLAKYTKETRIYVEAWRFEALIPYLSEVIKSYENFAKRIKWENIEIEKINKKYLLKIKEEQEKNSSNIIEIADLYKDWGINLRKKIKYEEAQLFEKGKDEDIETLHKYFNESDDHFKIAIKYYEKSLEKYREKENLVCRGEKEIYSKICNNLGICYHNTYNNKRAIDSYEEGLNIWKDTERKSNCSKFYNNKGVVYTQSNDYLNKHDLLKEAINCFKTANIYDSKNIKILTNLGIALYDLGNFHEALIHFNNVIKLIEGRHVIFSENEVLNRKTFTNYSNYCIGIIFFKFGDFEKSLEYLKKVASSNETLGIYANIIIKKINEIL